MCFIMALLPMTFWLVMAYLVFFLARRSDGARKVLGRALGIWLIGIACCFFILGAYVQLTGLCPIEQKIKQLFEAQHVETFYWPADSKGAARRSF